VLLTVMDTSQFASGIGITTGVSSSQAEKMKIVGSVVGTRLVDGASPIAYGYGEKVAAYCDNGPVFSLSSIAGSRPQTKSWVRRWANAQQDEARKTIRISRLAGWGWKLPRSRKAEIWENPSVTDEQRYKQFTSDSAGDACACGVAIRRRERLIDFRAGGGRRRNCATSCGGRCAVRQGTRGDVFPLIRYGAARRKVRIRWS